MQQILQERMPARDDRHKRKIVRRRRGGHRPLETGSVPRIGTGDRAMSQADHDIDDQQQNADRENEGADGRDQIDDIANFRGGLIRGIREAGYEPVVIAPKDEAADSRMRVLAVERIPVSIERSGLNPWTDFRLLRDYKDLLGRLRPAAYLGYTIKPNNC